MIGGKRAFGSSKMADAPLLSFPGENHVAREAVPATTPRSFSYRLDAGNDLLLGSRRSSSSSPFGSRRQSTESLPSTRRGSCRASVRLPNLEMLWVVVFEEFLWQGHECGWFCDGFDLAVYGFGSTFVQVDDTGVYFSSLAVTVALSALATLGILLFTVAVTCPSFWGNAMTSPSCWTRPTSVPALLSARRWTISVTGLSLKTASRTRSSMSTLANTISTSPSPSMVPEPS